MPERCLRQPPVDSGQDRPSAPLQKISRRDGCIRRPKNDYVLTGVKKIFFFLAVRDASCGPPQTDTISLLPPSKTILAVTDASFCGDGCISYQPPYICSSSHIMRSYPCRLESIREAPGRCVGEPQGPAVQKRSPFFPPRKKLFKICSTF